MNDRQASANIYGANLSLTKDEQALLRTALSSNSPRTSAMPSFAQRSTSGDNGTPNHKSANTVINNSNIYRSPDQGDFGFEGDTSPLGDFDLEDGNFDWDNSGDLFGDLPGLPNGDNTEHHDKRKKSVDDIDDEEETSGKRRESDEKTARKPGRKPLTGEPTTKRKAQNRAAQRAFRERKERHLKDLETKVEELEKASESTNHENGRLRAQVERLNTEVKEYRKRLSMTAPGIGPSPPIANPILYTSYQTTSTTNDFVFAFPKFGDLPGSFMNNGSFAKASPPASQNLGTSRTSPSAVPSLTRASSSQQSPTSKSPISPNGMANTMSTIQDQYQSPTTSFGGSNLEELNGLFSPSILENARRSNSADYMFPTNPTPPSTASKKAPSTDSYRAVANTPAFNQAITNGSTSSPSASSMSHAGLDSSCGTTPESTAESPEHRKISEASLNTINEEAIHGNSQAHVPTNSVTSPSVDVNGIDWLAQQNGGTFDPVLFGDYRDPQENIMNTNVGDFFNEAFLARDFSTPFNTGDITTTQPMNQQPTAAPAKADPITICEAAQNANDEPAAAAAPAAKPSQYLGCDKLWDRLQNSEKVTSGEMDMDDLCAQLKKKAKCSGKGAVVDQADVDAILGPAPPKQKEVPGEQKDFFSMFVDNQGQHKDAKWA